MPNPQLAIRIAASTAELKRNLAEGRAAVEALGPSVESMAKKWSSNSASLIQNARNITAAVDKIGVSTLTAADAAKNVKTLDAAIAQLARSGQPIPPMLQQTAEQLRAVSAGAKSAATELEKQPTMMDRINTRSVAMGAAIGTALGGVAWSAVNRLGSEVAVFADRGRQLGALQTSFETLSRGVKANSSEMLSNMKTASRGLVSEFDLMKAANKAMLLGLPVTAAEMGTLTDAATTLGRAMGQDATKSVDDLITALGRSSPMILDNLGLTVKVGEANDIYAAKLHTTADKLTDAQKKTAFYEEAMRKAKEKTEELGKSTKTLGELLESAWVVVGDNVTGIISDYNTALGAALSNTQNFGRFLSVAWSQGLGAAVNLFASMERGKGIVAELTDSQKKYVDELIRAKGIDVVTAFAEGDKAMMAYIKSLNLGAKGKRDLTEEEKAFAKAVQEQRDEILGIIRPTKEWAAALATLSKEQQLAAKWRMAKSFSGDPNSFGADFFGYGQIVAKEIEQGITASEGETLDEFLARRWKLGKSFSGTYSEGDPWGYGPIVAQAIESGVVAGPGESLEELLARRWKMAESGKFSTSGPFQGYGDIVGEQTGTSFVEAFSDVVSTVWDSVVRAIEGGGNVLYAAIGTLATGAGKLFADRFVAEAQVAGTGMAGAKLAGGLVSGIIGIGASIVSDMLKPVYTALEQVAMATKKSVGEITAELKQMGVAGVRAFEDMTRSGLSFANFRKRLEGMDDANSMMGLLGQFPTQEELNEVAEQWGGVYQYMLTSGQYTAAQLAEAWERYQEAVKAAVGAVDPEDTRPVGARGFPTKAQLQQAVTEAEEAYRYVRDSGLYTADVIEDAWNQWQDAMIASGDVTAKRMKDLNAEILTLQKAVEAETPEYDADGVRIYGVEEMRNIERLKALEAEKVAAQIANIEKEKGAVEVAAAAAALTATKEFEAAKLRANDLDKYLFDLFSKGYQIPITFSAPGVPGGSSSTTRPPSAGPSRPSFGFSRPTTSNAPTVNIYNPQVRSDQDIKELTLQVADTIRLYGWG